MLPGLIDGYFYCINSKATSKNHLPVPLILRRLMFKTTNFKVLAFYVNRIFNEVL